MRVVRKMLPILMSVVLVVGLCPGLAFANPFGEDTITPQAQGDGPIQEGPTVLAEGDFGEDDALHWVYKDDASLTISGTGAIPDYTQDGGQPWNAYQGTLEKLIVEDGVTRLGACAFMIATV